MAFGDRGGEGGQKSQNRGDVICERSLKEALKDQYGPRTFFLEFQFFAENMINRSILNLWWHSEILKLILDVITVMFTKRLTGARRLLYTVKSDVSRATTPTMIPIEFRF